MYEEREQKSPHNLIRSNMKKKKMLIMLNRTHAITHPYLFGAFPCAFHTITRNGYFNRLCLSMIIVSSVSAAHVSAKTAPQTLTFHVLAVQAHVLPRRRSIWEQYKTYAYVNMAYSICLSTSTCFADMFCHLYSLFARVRVMRSRGAQVKVDT